MRGHVRQRQPGVWSIVLEAQRGADGKRRQEWHTVHGSEREAHAELARLLVERGATPQLKPAALSTADYLRQWLEEHEAPRLGLAARDRYRSIVEGHLIRGLGKVALRNLTAARIEAHYRAEREHGHRNGGGLQESTLALHHRILAAALAHAVASGLIVRNPCALVATPRPAREERPALSDADVKRLLAAAQTTELYLPILLAVATGMRRGEVLALRWADLDLDRSRLTVRRSLEESTQGKRLKAPKNNRSRPIQLPAIAVAALRAQQARQQALRSFFGEGYQENDLVCCRPDGSLWPGADMYQAYRALAVKLKLPAHRFHDLRRNHATVLLELGEHPRVVADRLGHRDPALTLERYTQVRPHLQERLAERLNEHLTGDSEAARQTAVKRRSGA